MADFAAEGFTLVGGRLDYVDQHPVAALVYMRRKHVINVFEWPREPGSPAGPHTNAARTERGYHAVHSAGGGFEYWLVSDLDAGELARFARRLAGEAGGPGASGPPASP